MAQIASLLLNKCSLNAFHSYVCELSHFSCDWLVETLWAVARQAPCVQGIHQARVLEWVAMPSSRESSPPTSLLSPVLAGGLFTTSATWEAGINSSCGVCASPDGASGKEPTCQSRRHKRFGYDPRVRKIPWRRKWQPTPVVLPEEPHGQRWLAGYSPWGFKESDMIEHTHAWDFYMNYSSSKQNIWGFALFK